MRKPIVKTINENFLTKEPIIKTIYEKFMHNQSVIIGNDDISILQRLREYETEIIHMLNFEDEISQIYTEIHGVHMVESNQYIQYKRCKIPN